LFAAGDVARTRDPVTGERVTTGLWASARRQGRVAGLTMAGLHAVCPACAPCNIQHVGDRLFAAGGSLAAADRLEVDERGGSVSVLGFSGARLVGFNLFGDVRRAGPLLWALGREPRDPQDRRPGAAAALASVREGITWTTRTAG
jgi:NADPH-dependent 2,4-dienoyl-CoA reductase/sulfur reductase-like enzyme